jgi:glycosyltransferase involved in cell wall biosynthesis
VTSERISVVIIFLNAARFLGEAIESVMTQTRPAWELLLVDDGSSDSSSLIARRAAAASPERILYLAHPGHQNRGMSASRNLGAVSASSDLITFLDADDVLFPRALETLGGVLDREPLAAMAYGPVEYWYSWAGRDAVGRDFIQPLGVPAPALLEPPELLLRFLRRRAAAPSGMLVRAAVFREVGGFEDEFRGMYEDQAFCAKVCLRWAVVTTSDCVYRYRQHPASSSAAADRGSQHDFGRNAFLHWLQGYLVEQDFEAGPVAAAVRKERWWLQHPRLHRLARRLRAAPHGLVDRVRRLTGRRRDRRVLEPR